MALSKGGHPLKHITAIDSGLLTRLRDEFSVTTAEELIGLWKAAPEALTKALGGPAKVEPLVKQAAAVLSTEDVSQIEQAQQSSYPYATGHDAPPKGRETY
jgi:hypothetical protein